MALRLIQAPWTQQPQGAGVALAPRFAAARRGFVFNAGPGSLGDGSIGLSTINSAYTGPRFGPTPDGVGMRLYADHGGNDDDRPQSSFVLPTAKSANLTTVLVFAAINNTYMQGWVPTGHYLRITDPSAYKVQCGYFGDNGFNYIFEDARSDVFDGRAHTLVISTHITAKQISVSWDGNPCTYLSGSLSYIGGGDIPATGQPYLGDRVWTNYYNPNGHLLLWAYLPDVFLAQAEAHELARNPWSLFEPRRIFVPVSVGGGGSWSVSLTETASATDSLGAATTALVSLIESASAADIITAATIAAVALTEAASASDTQTASYSVTGSGSVTESASASDTLDAATTMLRALTETASADDQLAAATTMLRAISESASAVDTPAASYSGAGTATIEELTSATDALTAAATLLVTILEAGNADDALAAATTMVRAITEQAVAADEVAASQPIIASVSITELATAIDVLIGELAGGAWVAGDGLMSKPRIGMARNGDLYSLVLDDDGIPVACKRMGTSRLLKLRALPGGNQAQVMVETGVVLVVL